MKKIILLSLSLLAIITINAQTHFYSGKYTNHSDIMYTWDGEHIYKGQYTNHSDNLHI